MELRDWITEFERQARASGDRARQQLPEYLRRIEAARSRDPERALDLILQGRDQARLLGESWWALLFEHYHAVILHRMFRWTDALDVATRNAVEVRKPEYDGLPIRASVYQELIHLHVSLDPHQYEDRIREGYGWLLAEPNLDQSTLHMLYDGLAWLELSVDRLDAAEEYGQRLLALPGGHPWDACSAYMRLCEVYYRRADWDSLRQGAAVGETAARALGAELQLCEFLEWQAAALRVEGDERAAKRLHNQAETRINRSKPRGLALYQHAVAAFHEAGGDLTKALEIRHYTGKPRPPGEPLKIAIPPWQVCTNRIRICQLLAKGGMPLDLAAGYVREVAGMMPEPKRVLAKLERIEEMARDEEALARYRWSWQIGEDYTLPG